MHAWACVNCNCWTRSKYHDTSLQNGWTPCKCGKLGWDTASHNVPPLCKTSSKTIDQFYWKTTYCDVFDHSMTETLSRILRICWWWNSPMNNITFIPEANLTVCTQSWKNFSICHETCLCLYSCFFTFQLSHRVIRLVNWLRTVNPS